MSQSNEWLRIGRGILLLIGLHIAAICVGTVVAALLSGLLSLSPSLSALGQPLGFFLFYAFFAIGLSQLIYVIPTVVILKRDRQYGLMKGVIIGAVLTALLNGGCYLWFTQSFKL